jgi:hypothetical protein
LYKEECVYNTEQDGRRPAAKAYVAALEDRVKVLERLLEKHGLGEDGEVSEEVTHASKETMAAGGRGDDPEGRAGTGRVDSGLDRLKVGAPFPLARRVARGRRQEAGHIVSPSSTL